MESIYDSLPKIKGSGEILKNDNDFVKSKLKSLAVSKVLKKDSTYWIGRSQRMFECATSLSFLDGKLVRANFCRDRMCPACQKRRSLVVFHQVKNVCTAIAQDYPTYKYVLLTLTVPNVPIDELPSKISEMAKAWKRLVKRKEFMKSVKGWFRTLEITHNATRGDYHPHYHVLLCVPSSYFTKSYITHPRWLELWQQVMRDDSITQVDVRSIKPNPKKEGSDAIASAAAEVGKYATKPSDYLVRFPTKERYFAVEKIVQELAEGIARRKLVAFGGLMLEYSKSLNLKDVDSDSIDLADLDGDSPQVNAVAVQIFRWNIGFNNYVC